MATIFETEVCSRCGGTGHYSYCQAWGTRCFKCEGRTYTYTKRGAAASAFLRELCEKPVEELAVGEKFLHEGIPGFTGSAWRVVHSIEVGSSVKITTSKLTVGYGLGMKVKVTYEPTKLKTLQAQALAYQETLTKMGKPRFKFHKCLEKVA